MNQHTVSETSLNFGGFAGFAALDAPRVYGARSATVAAKTSSAGPKPAKKPTATSSSARNPNFGVEDIVKIRRAVARREIKYGMAECEAKLFATRFVMRIVLAEHTKNPQFEAMRGEIGAGVCETLVDEEKALAWLQATRKEIEAELADKTTTPVVVRPATKPVAHKAPEVCLPPKFDKEAIKQTLGAVDKLDKLDEAAQEVVSLLKGDDRYEAGERNELLAFTRDMVLGFAQVLGQSFRDAETTADATLEALPRKPRAMTTPKPVNVSTLSKTAAAPKPVVDAKPLTKEELAAYDMSKAKAVEVSQETPKAKREHKPLRLERLGEKVATDQLRASEREIEKAARAKLQAAKEAKAALLASDLKAGAQPPQAPKPPKKEKGGNDKKRGKKGQHAEARA